MVQRPQQGEGIATTRGNRQAEDRVTTLAGNGTEGFADGPGPTAQFAYLNGIAVAPNGTIYVGDTDNQRIRKIT